MKIFMKVLIFSFIASSAVACSSAVKSDERAPNNIVSSDSDGDYKRHLQMLDRIDRIR